MVQTRKGASNSEWLQFIKECGVLYRERKRQLMEECKKEQPTLPILSRERKQDPEIQAALPTPSPPKTRKRKARAISPVEAVDAPVGGEKCSGKITSAETVAAPADGKSTEDAQARILDLP